MARNHPEIKLYISHSTEYRSNDISRIKENNELIARLAPLCIPVDNPWDSPTAAKIVETHSIEKSLRPPFGASTDGTSASEKMDVDGYMDLQAKSIYELLWANRFNLKYRSNEATPINKRTAIPDENYMQAIVFQCYPKGEAPYVSFKAKPIKKPWVYKHMSEDSPSNDVRINKPMIILPDKAASFSVIDKNKKVLGAFRFYGTYSGGGYRYYSGTGMNAYGFQIANAAIASSGSPFVWFQSNETFYGPVNPIFRED
jgi:hypothetical protein